MNNLLDLKLDFSIEIIPLSSSFATTSDRELTINPNQIIYMKKFKTWEDRKEKTILNIYFPERVFSVYIEDEEKLNLFHFELKKAIRKNMDYLESSMDKFISGVY